VLDLRFLGVPSQMGRFMLFIGPHSSYPELQTHGATSCFFFKIKTRRTSASSELLVGFLAFVVWMLWSENNKSYN